MAVYKEEDCPFVYQITSVEKVVDGDTIDAVIDLGFDVRFCGRVRLLGIDTPESRTRNKEEKFYGLLAKKHLKEWVHKAILSDKDDINIELRCPEVDSRGKFGRLLGEIWVDEDGEWTNVNKWLCENSHAVSYWGQNKSDVQDEHEANRLVLAEQGIIYKIE